MLQFLLLDTYLQRLILDEVQILKSRWMPKCDFHFIQIACLITPSWMSAVMKIKMLTMRFSCELWITNNETNIGSYQEHRIINNNWEHAKLTDNMQPLSLITYSAFTKWKITHFLWMSDMKKHSLLCITNTIP